MWNNDLRDHLHASRIVAGSGIRVQHGSSGTIISATGTSNGGARMAAPSVSLPAGFFRVIDVAEYDDDGVMTVNALRLVNSAEADPSADHSAGICRAYGKTYDVPALDFEIQPTAKYIYFKFRGVDLEMPFICYGSDKILPSSDDLALLASINQETREIIQILPETQQLELGHGYEGGFAIMPMSDGRFKISDGASDCGRLEGWFVSKASDGDRELYCVARYLEAEKRYYLAVEYEAPNSWVESAGYFYIGKIGADGITQDWRGGYHYFGERYFI